MQFVEHAHDQLLGRLVSRTVQMPMQRVEQFGGHVQSPSHGVHESPHLLSRVFVRRERKRVEIGDFVPKDGNVRRSIDPDARRVPLDPQNLNRDAQRGKDDAIRFLPR